MANLNVHQPGHDPDAAPSPAPAPMAEPARLHLPGVSPEILRPWAAAQGVEPYRVDQILDWVFRKNAETFEQMSNLSKPLRAKLAEQAEIYRSRVTRVAASDDGTHKLLLTWPDETSVETVWIPDGGAAAREEGRNAGPRHTVCVSSQVGCPVGCRFCASGLNGVQRDLTAGEIVEQALRVRRLIEEKTAGKPAKAGGAPLNKPGAADSKPDARAGERLSNVVFMGMGEPLANYDNVIQAIRILNAPWGLGIGARKITLSTVGLPKQIRRLAGEDLQLNLALSLHAPEEELRRELIPWGKIPLADLLDACAYYFRKTGREVTLEYVLLAGVNDRPRHADKLAVIAKQLRANVNLLRYNPVPGLPYERPDAEAAMAFQQRLRARGANAHLRRSRGRDIDAACGQLRRAAAAAS